MSRLIKFETQNCMPCKMVDSLLESKGIKYEKFDVTKDPEMVEKYGVMSVPLLVLIDDEGDKIDDVLGFDMKKIEALLQRQ